MFRMRSGRPALDDMHRRSSLIKVQHRDEQAEPSNKSEYTFHSPGVELCGGTWLSSLRSLVPVLQASLYMFATHTLVDVNPMFAHPSGNAGRVSCPMLCKRLS